MNENAKKRTLKKGLSSFEGLGERELAALYNLAQIKTLKRGEILIQEGDTDQTVYIILDGVLGIDKEIQGETQEIASLSDGDWVGEIAFTKQIPRTATATAKTPCRVMTIDANTLEALDQPTQLFIYKKLNDLAAVRISDLSMRETELAAKNMHLMKYIRASKEKGRDDYQESEMIRSIIGKIPILPAYATNLITKLLEEEVSPNEIVEFVKDDPNLVALVLKTVNSPYYGLKNRISDIHHAIVLLGFNEIYQLLITDGVRRTMPDTPNFRKMLSQSVSISHICFTITQDARAGRPTEMATAGVLNGLGTCVVQLLKQKNPSLAMLIDALDPSQIGAMLLRNWGIPEKICTTLEYQINPEFSPPQMIPEEVRSMVAVLYMARLAYRIFSGEQEEELPIAFVDEYKNVLGWEGLPLLEIVDVRVFPSLNKKISTYPATLRNLLGNYTPKVKPKPKAQVA